LPSKPPATLHAIKKSTPKIGVSGDQKYDQNFLITKEIESLSPVFSPLPNSKAVRRVIAPAKTDQIIINPRTKTMRTTYSPHSTLCIDDANALSELHRPSLGEIKNPLITSNGVISTNLNAEPKASITKTDANALSELHRPSLGEIKNPLITSNGVISTNLNAEPKASITKTQRILKAIPTKAQTSLLKSSDILTPRRIL